MLNITQIIILIISIATMGFMIYQVVKQLKSQCAAGMTYSKEFKKCIPICSVGEKYYPEADECLVCKPGLTLKNGVCVAQCEEGEISCGGTCYPTLTTKCVNNKACPFTLDNCMKYHKDSDGKEVCCENCGGINKDNNFICCKAGERFDINTKNCTSCPDDHTPCEGAGCCDPGQICCGGKCCEKGKVCDDYGTCCEKENIHKDKDNKNLCCPNFATIDGCCTKGETVSDDGKFCVEKCGNETCYPNKDPPTECQTVTFSDGSINKGCSNPVTCKEKVEFSSNPANLYTLDKDYQAGISVCKDPNNKLWFCKNEKDMSGLSRDVTTTLNPGKCSTGDCWSKVEAVNGSHDATYDKSSGNCKAKIDCSHKDSPTSTLCTEYDKNLLDTIPDKSLCKDDKGNLTGQICPNTQTCDQDGNCFRGWIAVKGPEKLRKDKNDNPIDPLYPGDIKCQRTASFNPNVRIYPDLETCMNEGAIDQPCPNKYMTRDLDILNPKDTTSCYRTPPFPVPGGDLCNNGFGGHSWGGGWDALHSYCQESEYMNKKFPDGSYTCWSNYPYDCTSNAKNNCRDKGERSGYYYLRSTGSTIRDDRHYGKGAMSGPYGGRLNSRRIEGGLVGTSYPYNNNTHTSWRSLESPGFCELPTKTKWDGGKWVNPNKN